jgi:hypothetical protein
MRNWLFGLPGEIICEQSLLMSQKIMCMPLTLLFTCLAFFGLGDFGLPCPVDTFFPYACIIIARVSVPLSSEICTQFDAVPSLD